MIKSILKLLVFSILLQTQVSFCDELFQLQKEKEDSVIERRLAKVEASLGLHSSHWSYRLDGVDGVCKIWVEKRNDKGEFVQGRPFVLGVDERNEGLFSFFFRREVGGKPSYLFFETGTSGASDSFIFPSSTKWEYGEIGKGFLLRCYGTFDEDDVEILRIRWRVDPK